MINSALPVRKKRPPLATVAVVLWVATIITIIPSFRLFSDYSYPSSTSVSSLCDDSLSLSLTSKDRTTHYYQHNNRENATATTNSTTPTFPLKVAWLMSFPNSGTSYTLRIVRQISNKTTATNYGEEHLSQHRGASILLHSNWTQGPFRADTTLDLPPAYILTKTHCGGRCVHCAPDGYLETLRSFERACLGGGKRYYQYDMEKPVQYSRRLVQRAVHLIRHPLDNIVARYHLSRRHEIAKQHEAATGNITNSSDYNNNATVNMGRNMTSYLVKQRRKEQRHEINLIMQEIKKNESADFQAWCQKLDKDFVFYESHTRWLDDKLRRLWQSVPCHAEFYKYIQWHNLAWIVSTTKMGIPSYIHRYEDYGNIHDNEWQQKEKWQSSVQRLFDFLHLDAVSWEAASSFHVKSYYMTHYTDQQRHDIRKFLHNMATEPIWNIVKQYPF